MAKINKPLLKGVWAEAGAKVMPSDEKWQLGWTAEIPPHQWMNALQNRMDTAIAHNNQSGVNEWDAGTDYLPNSGSYVKGSDGKIYKSVNESGSNDPQNPVTDVAKFYWKEAFAEKGNVAISEVVALQTTLDKKFSLHVVGKSYLKGEVVGMSTGAAYVATQNTTTTPTDANTHWSKVVGARDLAGIAGIGLTEDNGKLKVVYGTASGTSAQGNDTRLSDEREWTATTISEAEVKAGTSTTRRAFTSQRVRQGVMALVDTDQNLGGALSSDSKIPSQKAVKEYIDSIQDGDKRISWFSYNISTNEYIRRDNAKPTSTHTSMKRCLLNDDGSVNYYLDEFDSNTKSTSGASNLIGADGQVMVEIPKFWAKKTLVGNIETWYQSDSAESGLPVHPAFIKNGVEVDFIYIGAYQATVWSATSGSVINGLNLDNNFSRVNLGTDKLCSLSGNYVMVGLGRQEFRQLASNRGDGWQLTDFLMWQAVMILFFTEFGSLNSQSTLGDGNVHASTYPASSSNQGSSPHTVNGVSNSAGNQSISMTSPTPFVSYRGIEHPWGNAWVWVDGINILSYDVWVCDDSSKFADDTQVGYVKIGGKIPEGVTSGSPIRKYQDIPNSPIALVESVSGNNSNYVGDDFWSDSGNRAVSVGGLADHALRAGVGAFSANHAFGSRNRHLGSRLAKK